MEILAGQPQMSLRKRIKLYQSRVQQIKDYLAKYPSAWGKFQSEFNQEVNGVFRDLMIFEKENIANGNERSVYKLKRFFERRFRHEFSRGQYVQHSIEKPYGYAGDFQVIDWIYQNQATSTGFDRLFDNYFLQSPASTATRNRKEDFKRIIFKSLSERDWKGRILDLASGPCRDIFELMRMEGSKCEQIRFTCLDNDINAINFAKGLLNGISNVDFVKENVVRLALKKDIVETYGKFDLIFSTGLYDYLEDKLAMRLIANLKRILVPGGLMVISNYRDKYSNPSIHFMEWVGDWNLVYRTEEDFLQCFMAAGFKQENLSLDYEQQGIMQYCFAKNEM